MLCMSIDICGFFCSSLLVNFVGLKANLLDLSIEENTKTDIFYKIDLKKQNTNQDVA